LQFVIRANAPHVREHALEVELPFLQTILPSFRVAPLVVCDALPQDVALALRRMWGGPETLIVVSSDLSHYHDYETARRLDSKTAAAIEHGDWVSLGPNEACGYLAVAGLVMEPDATDLKPAGSRCAIRETRQARVTVSLDTELGCLARQHHRGELNTLTAV
jgi:MEMO1 family protein